MQNVKSLPTYRKVISKVELCHALGLVSPSGRPRLQTLASHFFTDALLDKIGWTREQYKRVRLFPYHISKQIQEEFELTTEDFN